MWHFRLEELLEMMLKKTAPQTPGGKEGQSDVGVVIWPPSGYLKITEPILKSSSS